VGRLKRGLRRQSGIFFLGFGIAALLYLVFRYGMDDLLAGIAIGAAGGVIALAGGAYLDRRFPDDKPAPPASES
jgi:hypothetical protein